MAISNKIRHRLIDVGRDIDFLPRIRTILEQAGVKPNYINLGGAASEVWLNVINYTDTSNQLDDFLVKMISHFPHEELINIKEDIAKSSVAAMCNHLKSAIKNNQCVLFIGPEILRCNGDDNKSLTFNKFLSTQLAAELDKPELNIFYERSEKENLSYIIDRYETKKKFVPGDTEQFSDKVYRDNQMIHCYKDIIKLNFPLIINTNPDILLPDLIGTNKCVSRYYDMTNTTQQPFPKGSSDPIVYNIFGSFDNMFSIIFTEKEAVQFSRQAYERTPPIPKEITEIIKKSYGLFIGFDFKEWHLKILFDVLDLNDKPGNYAVSDVSTNIFEYDKEYYERRYNMTFLKNKVSKFLEEIK